MFRRLIPNILAFFIIWIMPLGAFIDPDHSDKVCGGQRAICLCLKNLAKHGGPVRYTAPHANKEAASPATTSHEFLVSRYEGILSLRNSKYFELKFLVHSALVCKILEPVPKFYSKYSA